MRDPSLLVPFEHSDATFGRMHRDVVGLFTALLDELVPHVAGGIAAIRDDGCWNPASMTVGGDRSFHTYAIAIDVNWSANPMYASRRPAGPGALPALTSAIARKWGCEWGGDWSYPEDWMHIECHLPPNIARTIQPGAPAPVPVPPEEDDDMRPVITITTHPASGAKRAFVLGPKGLAELEVSEEPAAGRGVGPQPRRPVGRDGRRDVGDRCRGRSHRLDRQRKGVLMNRRDLALRCGFALGALVAAAAAALSAAKTTGRTLLDTRRALPTGVGGFSDAEIAAAQFQGVATPLHVFPPRVQAGPPPLWVYPCTGRAPIRPLYSDITGASP